MTDAEKIISKLIANVLLNLPKETRKWLEENVSPHTVERWCKQMFHNVISRKDLNKKIEAIKNGTEELSDLAKWEKKDYFEAELIKELNDHENC